MRGYGHRVADLDVQCCAIFHRRITAPYLQELLHGVEQDRKLFLVLQVLERYADTGRFYNLDVLADATQPEPAPEHLWRKVEDVAIAADPDSEGIVADLSGPGFDKGRQRINRALADSLDRWHELYYRAWTHGVIGDEAKRYAVALNPRA